MAYITGRCPNCGGEVQLDASKEQGFCLHCGSKITVSDATQKVEVKISGQVKLQQSTAAELFEKAEQFLKVGDFEHWHEYAYKATEADPLNAEIKFCFLYNLGKHQLNPREYNYASVIEGSYYVERYDKGRIRAKARIPGYVDKAFKDWLQLCRLDPANKVKYINGLAQFEAKYLHFNVHQRALARCSQKVFNKKFDGVYKVDDASMYSPNYWLGYAESITEEHLPGFANIFKEQMKLEVKKLSPQLYDLLKGRL